jgi:hypothetical protein
MGGSSNYVLYKLLYHKFYEVDEQNRLQLKSNLDILKGLLERRGISKEMKDSTLASVEALDRELRQDPRKYIRKLKYNWKMFCAVQPGPVSICIILLYISCILVLGSCGVILWH